MRPSAELALTWNLTALRRTGLLLSWRDTLLHQPPPPAPQCLTHGDCATSVHRRQPRHLCYPHTRQTAPPTMILTHFQWKTNWGERHWRPVPSCRLLYLLSPPPNTLLFPFQPPQHLICLLFLFSACPPFSQPSCLFQSRFVFLDFIAYHDEFNCNIAVLFACKNEPNVLLDQKPVQKDVSVLLTRKRLSSGGKKAVWSNSP